MRCDTLPTCLIAILLAMGLGREDRATAAADAPEKPASPQTAPPDTKPAADQADSDSYDRPVRRGAEVGNKGGGGAFQDARGDGSIVVGCEVSLLPLGDHCLMVKSVKPIFESADGKRSDGEVHGRPSHWPVRVEAEPGYALAQIVGRAGERIDGFCLVFMRRKGDKLDPSDRYVSRWLGTRNGLPLVEVGDAKNRPATGVAGRSGIDLDGVGLIFE